MDEGVNVIDTKIVKRNDITTKLEFSDFGFEMKKEIDSAICTFLLKYKRPHSDVFDAVIDCPLTISQLSELSQAIITFIGVKDA